MIWKILPYIVAFLLGSFLTPITQEFARDIYRSTVGKLFSPYSRIELHSVSNTILDTLDKYRESLYYEITSFRIENKGTKATKENDQLKIQARGEIIGITPRELKSKLIFEDKDKSVAYLDIGSLEPGDKIEGEIHSFSTIFVDRNEAQLGFDKIGNYEFSGPNPL